ncbi:MAG: hypothetical protein AB7E66_11125, partial [Parvibaculaceae bacterium]
VEYGDDPLRPEPRQGGGDMLDPITGSLAHDGIVVIWANGQYIARARGTIGIEGAGGPLQYLKLGHNRAPLPGTATIYYDRFKRGATRADVE